MGLRVKTRASLSFWMFEQAVIALGFCAVCLCLEGMECAERRGYGDVQGESREIERMEPGWRRLDLVGGRRPCAPVLA